MEVDIPDTRMPVRACSLGNRTVEKCRSVSCSTVYNLRRGLLVYQQRKLRFGAVLLIAGCLLAAVGEIINATTTDVLSSTWRFSLSFIVVGTFILLIGLSTFASVSERINGFGFVGSTLLQLGGFGLMVGVVALDWILVPFLIHLANTIAATINGPATVTQDELNKIIASLNNLGGSLLRTLFPNAVPHIPAAHIPMANGVTLVNKALVQLHLPTIESLTWWGHFSLSGGTLILGSFILGLALPRRNGRVTATSILLIVFALLNLCCQLVATMPFYYGNITAAVLFLTLAWLGLSAWSAEGRVNSSPERREIGMDVEDLESEEVERDVPGDKTTRVLENKRMVMGEW